MIVGRTQTIHSILRKWEGPKGQRTSVENITGSEGSFRRYTNEFWTSKQRQASSIHEISYRACFKPQLPRLFIDLLTNDGDIVYDPFSGRGTTVVEAGLSGRTVIANDANPLSRIMTEPRFSPVDPVAVAGRLSAIPASDYRNEIDLSMFYHPATEREILDLRHYLLCKKEERSDDPTDRWLAMVASNRLTGHSSGFFSVYSLPPNQAVSQDSQKRINQKRQQVPEYRDTHSIILKKTKSLLRSLTDREKSCLKQAREKATFLTHDAGRTPEIRDGIVQLTVTSPPFLDIVQYREDNWLRCWFNGLDSVAIGKTITMAKSPAEWVKAMDSVFHELYRVTRLGGFVAFEVGEIRKRSIRLDEHVVPLGINAGFECVCVLVNQQNFTKTSNIWGVNNMEAGTNTNRIVLFCKS